MKPFNLEQALAGKKVVTRDGLTIVDLVYFKSADSEYKLYGVDSGIVRTWRANGRYDNCGEYGMDLFMATEKKTVWVNLYKDAAKEIPFSCGALFYSQELAIRYADGNELYHSTHPIEIEV